MAKLIKELVVGGLIKLSTIDYPDMLSAVVFCQGCPWRCSYCHNQELLPVTGNEHINWHEIIEFLKQRKGLLDAVVFSGGEPTLQPGLVSAIQQVRALGFKIGLHSAGYSPRLLHSILSLIDWIGLDIKTVPADYPRLTGALNSGWQAWESAVLVIESGVYYEIRITAHPALLDVPTLESTIRQLRNIGARNIVVQECRTNIHLDWVGTKNKDMTIYANTLHSNNIILR